MSYFPSTNSEELSDAIVDLVNNGANIINLSSGLTNSSLTLYTTFQDADDYAGNLKNFFVLNVQSLKIRNYLSISLWLKI
jgi:hypothetical protein